MSGSRNIIRPNRNILIFILVEEPQNFPVVSSENNNQIHLNKNTICFSKSSVCEGQSELRLRGVLFLFS